jgi:hypothetical protein
MKKFFQCVILGAVAVSLCVPSASEAARKSRRPSKKPNAKPTVQSSKPPVKSDTPTFAGVWRGVLSNSSNCPAIAKIPASVPLSLAITSVGQGRFSAGDGSSNNSVKVPFGTGSVSGSSISFKRTRPPAPGCTIEENLRLQGISGPSAQVSVQSFLKCPAFAINCSINSAGSVKK